MRDLDIRQLGDVDQPLNAGLDLGERAKIDHVGHQALDQLAQLVRFLDHGPRLWLQALQTEANAFPVVIQPQDIDLDLLADTHHLSGVPDPPPAQFRQMHQTIRTAQIDKCAKGTKAGDPAGAYLTLTQLRQQSLALRPAPLPLRAGGRQDQAALAAIDLDHLDHQLVADPFREALQAILLIQPGGESRHLGSGHKAPDLFDRDDQPALVVANHLTFPNLALVMEFLGVLPGFFLSGHVQRHQQVAVLVLWTHDKDHDFVAGRQLGNRLFSHALQVGAGNDSIALGTDVDNDLLGTDIENDTGANLPATGPGIIPILYSQLGHLGGLVEG